jgi:hypothetical protein
MRNTHEQLMKKFLSDSDNKAEYDKLEEEFTLLNAMLEARTKCRKNRACAPNAHCEIFVDICW